jgi:hypothetical protein
MEGQEMVILAVVLVWAGVDLVELVVEVPGEKSLQL